MRERRRSDQPVNLDFILSRSMPEPNSGCWIWMGAVSRLGYGSVGYGGRVQRTSRVVMELMTGAPVPSQLFVCHRCDNPYCVNPDHLFLGTPRGNVQDCLVKGRHVAPRGFKHGRSAMSPETVRAIRESTIRPQRALATAFGISRATAQRIIYRQSYIEAAE